MYHSSPIPHLFLWYGARITARSATAAEGGSLVAGIPLRRRDRTKVRNAGEPHTLLRAGLLAYGTGTATLLVIGLPAAVIPNPWFLLVIPTQPLDDLVLGITALLAAAFTATMRFPPPAHANRGSSPLGASSRSWQSDDRCAMSLSCSSVA